MRKFFAWVLVLMLIVPVVANAQDMALTASVSGMRVLEEYNGQTSDEYDWFVLGITLTNWHTDTQSISENLSGTLAFKESYIFEAEPSFDGDTIAPLVEKQGNLVFTIPKMVANSMNSEDVALSICVEGTEQSVELNIASSTGDSDGKIECVGYDTPKEAVLAYLDGMNAGDPNAMLSTFAIESYAEHAVPENYLLFSKMTNISQSTAIPLEDEYSRILLQSERYGELAKSLFYQYYRFATNTNGEMIQINDSASYWQLINQFQNNPIAQWKGNVEFIEWLEPAALTEYFLSSQNLSTTAVNASCYGAEDVAFAAAHIRLNGVDAIQTMECVQYGGRWFNMRLDNSLSVLLGLSNWSAGLLYPSYSENDGISDAEISQFLTMLDSESSTTLNNLANSDLGGTTWQLTQWNSADSINVADTKEGIDERNDYAVYGQLHFLSTGGAYAEFRYSAGLVQTNGGYDISVLGMAWTDQGGVPVLEEIRSYGENMIDMQYGPFTRDGDVLTLRYETGEFFSFTKVEAR